MKPLVLATALSLLALATLAAAQTSAPAPVKAGAEPNDPNKPVCKSQPIEGTRFMKRICMTRSAWAELERRRLAAQGPQSYSTPDPAFAAPAMHGRGVPMQ